MSRPSRSFLALGLLSVGLAVSATPATAAAPLLKPTNPKCATTKTEKDKKKRKLCGGRFKDRTRTSWWSKPAEFRIVDVSIIGTTKIEALADDEMRFNGEGEIWISARKGFGGKFRLPKPGPGGVGIGTITAKGIDWTSRSTGAWITSVGTEYGCGTTLENGPLAPTAVTALVATDPRKDELSINWNVGGPAWRCPKDVVDAPPFDEKFSDSSLVRYRASSFRGHELVRLPVTAKWSRESYPSRTTVELSGHVLLQRVR